MNCNYLVTNTNSDMGSCLFGSVANRQPSNFTLSSNQPIFNTDSSFFGGNKGDSIKNCPAFVTSEPKSVLTENTQKNDSISFSNNSQQINNFASIFNSKTSIIVNKHR